MQPLTFTVPGNLGNIEGADADGVLVGQGTMDDPAKALVKHKAAAGLCITDDGGSYVNETTPFGESTGDDVEIMRTAAEDNNYFGHATAMFDRIDVNITTQGVSSLTITWEYWNGTAYTALSGVTDGTTGFTAATGWVSVTFTRPGDWVQNTVDGVLGYWVRARVSAWTSETTPCQLGQGYVISDDFFWTDETTDATDAGADDFPLVGPYPLVGDGLYLTHAEAFCKVKLTIGTAAVGTYTVTPKYWNGTAYASITTYDDDTVAFTATAGTHIFHFSPPSDWVANTAANGPNGNAGYSIVLEVTAFTSLTTQGLGTQVWVLPLKTGLSGVKSPVSFSTFTAELIAGTKSATNTDSAFIVVNASQGTCAPLTWTKGDQHIQVAAQALAVSQSEELALIQITEDGTTEFADANIILGLGT